MANLRTPKAKAEVAGRVIHDPKRFKERREPIGASDLGSPPPWMDETQKAVWFMFAREIPWLNGSHRTLLEIAVSIRARMVSKQDVGVQALQLLRQCLGQMGATPADATKVVVPDDGEKDPEEEFFGRPN
jgi:hypothetical protein